MTDVVIDTDVASVLQKDRALAWGHRHLSGTRIWLSFITVAELSKWAEVRNWGNPARRRLDRWITSRPVIPYDPEVARTWVAACCIRHDLPLVTLNIKDYVDFATHDGLILLTEEPR